MPSLPSVVEPIPSVGSGIMVGSGVMVPVGKGGGNVGVLVGACVAMGVSVGAGDLNGDGIDEIVTIPGRGAAPLVKIFNASGKSVAPDFYAFAPSDTAGADITISDVDGDGQNEIVAMSFSIFNQ